MGEAHTNFAAIAFRKEDVDLRATYDEQLAKLKGTETFAAIMKKYGFGEPEADDWGDVAVGATGRSQADAPEIDGAVYLRNVPASLKPGDVVQATVEDADAHDLFGVIV